MNSDWAEPILLQHEYRVGTRKKPITVRLAFPSKAGNDREWRCCFQITGLKNDKVCAAHGVDGLQALTNAARAIRKLLDRSKPVMSDAEPYEFVYPLIVRMSYGLDFHRDLCKKLQNEIEKKEKQLSKKRLARKK